MTSSPKPPGPDDAAAKDASLSDAERAELQRQGAKSAARGERAAANPMREPLNEPRATGETPGTWVQRSDAWEQGHKAQSATRREDARAGPGGTTPKRR